MNLCTAFVASRVVGAFEGSIEKLAALAALMPIVAGIGGNSGNQTTTLIVRALALGQVSAANARRLLIKSSNSHLHFTASEEDAVASAIDAARQRPALEAGLARLSNGEREVIELVAYDGLTPAEVAEVLKLSPNAARLRLSRARRHLRQILEPISESEAHHAI